MSPRPWTLAAVALGLLAACRGAEEGSGGAAAAPLVGDELPDGRPGPTVEAVARVGEAVITGTAVDADTGSPVPGAYVRGPRGEVAVTDASGRFVLPGLPPGSEGLLEAQDAEGRVAANPLRPLREGILEVVLRLRRP